nr:hypothetical protein [Candidatus Sigynarchaeota archaeon]
MASDSDEKRLFDLLENISNAAMKLEDFSSRTDILCNITRSYVKIADKTKEQDFLKNALEHANKVNKSVFDYNGLREQAIIARQMQKMGMKIQSLNLLWRIEEDSKRIKDLTLRIDVMLEITETMRLLKENENYELLLGRITKAIETSTNPLVVKIDAYMLLHKHYVLAGDEKRAGETLDLVLKHMDNGIEQAQKGGILRTVVNTYITISRAIQENKIQYLMKAIDLVKKYTQIEDTDLIYNDIFKDLFLLEDPAWIKQNTGYITGTIQSMDKMRIKTEILFNFLTKIYREKIDIDPASIKQLLDVLENADKVKLGPSRYIAFQLMRLQLIGIFDGQAKFIEGIESLLKEMLHSSQFRKDLQEWVEQTLNVMVDFFKLFRPPSIEILEKALVFTNIYAIIDIKNDIVKNIILAMVDYAISSKNPELLAHCVDLSKTIDTIDDRIFVSTTIGNAWYELNNVPHGQDLISACLDELINVKKPTARIKARINLAQIVITRQYDIDGALILLEDSVQDANMYLVKLTNKTVALHEVTNEAVQVYTTLFDAEEDARRQKYNSYMAKAKEEIDTRTRKGVENAINLYEQSLDMMNGSTDRYEHAWVSEQITRLRNYLQHFSEETHDEFPAAQTDITQKEKFKVNKSDIVCKQTVFWRKKREMLYTIQVANNAHVQVTELYCKIKKYAGEYLEIMHDTVQKTQVLKPNGTFTCEFDFTAKRDIVPNKAIEAEVVFFDPVAESTITIELEPPTTSAAFKFFEPKSINVDKFDKMRQKLDKKSHEISVPFNVYLTWKKVTSQLKKLPFTIASRDFNEIANQFFGVIRLYGESRWPKARKFSTLLQIIVSGDVNEQDSNVKLEFFIQDTPIFYNLVNMFQELIEVFDCPNVDCNGPLDKAQVKPDSFGMCKFCSQLFYLEANLAKLDRPLRLRTVTLASLLDDAESIDVLTRKIKQLKKEGLEVFLNGFSSELKEKYREVFDKVAKGELKVRDFLADSIKKNEDKIIQALLIQGPEIKT